MLRFVWHPNPRRSNHDLVIKYYDHQAGFSGFDSQFLNNVTKFYFKNYLLNLSRYFLIKKSLEFN